MAAAFSLKAGAAVCRVDSRNLCCTTSAPPRTKGSFLIFCCIRGTMRGYAHAWDAQANSTLCQHGLWRTRMKMLASPVALILLSLITPALAETGNPADLRYCLELKSNEAIAKCAGEISPGPKGKPMSRQEAERALEKEQMSTPTPRGATSEAPAASSSIPATR